MADSQQITLAGGKLSGARIGAGRDLLIIHSLLADRTAFDPVLPWLAERFRVTLVDVPGFYASHPSRPASTIMPICSRKSSTTMDWHATRLSSPTDSAARSALQWRFGMETSSTGSC